MAAVDDVPAVEDFVNGASDPEADANGHVESEKETRVYFVRIPRPPMDETLTKKLQADFQTHVERIKKLNAKLATKRGEVKELRQQMNEARGVKDESHPEYEDKLNRLKSLREMRNSHQNKIAAIRQNLKGLECRSEAELDAKIRELEEKISLGAVELREEKNIVKQITSLQSKRGAIKDYDLHKDELGALEAECNKVRALITDLEGEFGPLKQERETAKAAVNAIKERLKTVDKQLQEIVDEQAEAVKAKEDAMEELNKARQGTDDTMKDYRDNRKFSLQVRDLVAAGQVDEARALAVEQTDALIERLATDAEFRREYYKIASEQRKFMVSEVLPESSISAMQAAAEKAKAEKAAAKGSKGAAAKAAGPTGKEKAEALIASLMQAASKEAQEVQRQRALMAPRQERSGSSDAEDDEPTAPPTAAAALEKARALELAPKPPAELVKDPAAKAAEVFGYKVEMPKVQEVEFVVPIIKAETESEQATKQRIREEQKRLAMEAEQRKQKRQEQAEKKKNKAIEAAAAAKKEEERKALQAAQAAALERKAAAAAAAAAAAGAQEAEALAASSGAQQSSESKPLSSKAPPKERVAKAAQPGAAAKRRPEKPSLEKKLKKLWLEHQTMFAVAVIILMIAIIYLLISRMGK